MGQKDCMYVPRVIGVSVDAQVKNDDIYGHNVHSRRWQGNNFNQPAVPDGVQYN
jgi:hypothetical protein